MASTLNTIANAAARPGSPAAGDTLYQEDTKQIITWDGASWQLYDSDEQASAELYYDNNAAGFTSSTPANGWYLGAGVQPDLHFAADMMEGDSHDIPSGWATTGEPVDAWGDISGNGNDLSQASAGNQPTWYGNISGTAANPGFRKGPVVYFDGTNEHMSLGSVVSLSGAYTYMYVGYKSWNSSSDGLCALGTSGAWLHINYSTPDTRSGLDTGAYTDSTYGPNYYDTQLFTVVRDGSNNGTTYVSGMNSVDTTTVSSSKDVSWMGRDYNQYGIGYVYEAILFTSLLSTDNLNNVRNYLSNKYGLTTTAFS